jgi:hypothetical protein
MLPQAPLGLHDGARMTLRMRCRFRDEPGGEDARLLCEREAWRQPRWSVVGMERGQRREQ